MSLVVTAIIRTPGTTAVIVVVAVKKIRDRLILMRRCKNYKKS